MANLKDLSVGTIAGDDPQKQIESLVKQLNEWGREISNEGITKIYKDDAGTQRVLLGKGADGFQGVKVSQEGSDVYTAADDKLVMSSGFNSFKIVASGTVVLNKPANTETAQATIPHSLGYAPLAVVYFGEVGDTENTQLNYYSFAGAVDSYKVQRIMYFDSNATELTITWKNPSWAGNQFYTNALDYSFRYYLLVETASTT